MNFPAIEMSLGRQRTRQWLSLITQQLRLRHIYQIYAFNLPSERRVKYYFTLHNTPMSSPFYTSEKLEGRSPKWSELVFQNINTSALCIVLRIWKYSEKGDEIVLTWGVNLSGLVYLGSKMSDLQSRYFKANTVIFFMQGGFFTSQDYIRTDLHKPLPFQKNLNLIEKANNELVLYRRVASKATKTEMRSSYTLEKLRKLQELQRLLEKQKKEVELVKQNIKQATEREQKYETPHVSEYSNNIHFAPQLLTMNCLNKMLHEKPTKSEREQMAKLRKKIEKGRFRVRILNQERDRQNVILRGLKQKESRLAENNEEQNSNLMSMFHVLSKETQRLEEYKKNLLYRKEYLNDTNQHLFHRQRELLKELLFIYPVEKIPNEHKYTILGIYLPDSEILTDYQDPGISVALGYICHILIMCSIFLQVPLRYPMRHFGSRSVIYDQVSSMIPDKEREFPLYTKGRDRAHFSYAVFLLNQNLSQFRWYLYRWYTMDLKETLKHLLHFLLATDNMADSRHSPTSESGSRRHKSGQGDHKLSLDKLVSLSLSSTSSSIINDPLLDRALEEIRQERYRVETTSSPRKLGSPKKGQNKTGNVEVLAVPEAYLNRQISKDLFHKCACEGYKFADKFDCSLKGSESTAIPVKDGIEELSGKPATSLSRSDSVEQGTDPLDPTTNIEVVQSKPIDIKTTDCVTNKAGCSSSTPHALSCSPREQWLLDEAKLKDRTDRLLSTNQSFNLVKHRVTEY